MRKMLVLVCAAALAHLPSIITAEAGPAHNGTCVKFAGKISGQNYAGAKCYLDSSPGDYVIRMSVKERDDPELYRKIIRLRGGAVRCTLTEGGTFVHNGTMQITYKLSNC